MVFRVFSEAAPPPKKLQTLLNGFLKIQCYHLFGDGKSKSELFRSNVLRYKVSQGKTQVKIPSVFDLSLCGMFRFRVAVRSLPQSWLWRCPHAAMSRYLHTATHLCFGGDGHSVCPNGVTAVTPLCDCRPPSKTTRILCCSRKCQVHTRNNRVSLQFHEINSEISVYLVLNYVFGTFLSHMGIFLDSSEDPSRSGVPPSLLFASLFSG